jgi:hypothetical protein
MGPSPPKSTMHVVEGRPWKEAVITVLEPRSPYRPWRADEFDRIKDGDRVVAVLDTDPVSVLATVGFVGADGDVHTTLAGIEQFELGGSPALLELDTLNMVSTVHLPASAGMLHRDEFAVMRRLTDCWSDSMDANRVRTSLGTPTVGNLATELNVPTLVLIDYLRMHGVDCTDPDFRLTPDLAQRLRLEFRPSKLVHLPEDAERMRPINAGKVLWCPLCDWSATDSMITRQRMGLHLADEHYAEIAFPPGQEPDDLEPA